MVPMCGGKGTTSFRNSAHATDEKGDFRLSDVHFLPVRPAVDSSQALFRSAVGFCERWLPRSRRVAAGRKTKVAILR